MSSPVESRKLNEVLYILFQASLRNEKLNYNELRRRVREVSDVSGKYFKKLIDRLEELKLIERKEERVGGLTYSIIELTELGKIVGWAVFLRNFINAYLSMLNFISAYLEIKIEGKASKDLILSELMVNALYAIAADLVINGFKAMILKGSPDFRVFNLLFNEAYTSMSALYSYARNIKRDVLLNTLDQAYKQIQKEFLEYLIEHIDLKSIYSAFVTLRERAPEHAEQVEELLNFIAHLIKAATSMKVKTGHT